MRKAIWKFQLETTDTQVIQMPIGSEILCVQTQKEKPCIWVLVNPEKQQELRNIDIFGTGHEISDSIERSYLGTYQLNSGPLVFHVFERIVF